MSRFNSEVALQNNRCECYKKLQFLGVPLYKNEEDEEYAEGHGDILYESSFQLPGELRINTQIIEYPVVDENNLPAVFCKMGQVIPNLFDFELNVLSFWLLDMFVEGLWTAQKAGMKHDHQRATLLWIAYLFNYVQKENPSRKELFLHLKIVILLPDNKRNEYSGEELLEDSTTSAKESSEEGVIWELPLPPGTSGVTAESEFSMTEKLTSDVTLTEADGEGVIRDTNLATKAEGEESVTERNLRHMKIILEILYRIFARLWVFLEIQAVFHVMPSVEQVDLPFNLGIPKPAAKTDPFAAPKVEKAGKKMSAVEGLTEETEMEKQLHKNDYILPLQVLQDFLTSRRRQSSECASAPFDDVYLGRHAKDSDSEVSGNEGTLETSTTGKGDRVMTFPAAATRRVRLSLQMTHSNSFERGKRSNASGSTPTPDVV